MQVASSLPVIISEEAGGVPKSIAEALWRVSQNPYMPKANYDGDGKSNSDGGDQGQTSVSNQRTIVSTYTIRTFGAKSIGGSYDKVLWGTFTKINYHMSDNTDSMS